MKSNNTEADKRKGFTRRQIVVIFSLVVILGVLAFYVSHRNSPKRSIAAYCTAINLEHQRLAKLPGDTWPSGLFDAEVSNANEIANSLATAERVAPKNLSEDLKTLRNLYLKVDKDPSSAIDASIAGGDIDYQLRDWSRDNCDLKF